MIFISIEALFYMVVFLSIYARNGREMYRITSHHLSLSPATILHLINGISVRQCVEECSLLPECSAVIYKRLYKLCEIHSDLHENHVTRSGEPCLYVKRDDIYFEEESTDDCQNCERDNCGSNHCNAKFCAGLEIKNGILLGNMKSVGSRVEIKCIKYFKEISRKTHTICQSNGTWSYYPKCIPSFNYIGCFEDKKIRIVQEEDIRPALLTTEMCVRICISMDYEYSLTEAGYACFCGNSYKNYPRKPDNECDTPCQGNPSEMCGGQWRGSLYRHY